MWLSDEMHFPAYQSSCNGMEDGAGHSDLNPVLIYRVFYDTLQLGTHPHTAPSETCGAQRARPLPPSYGVAFVVGDIILYMSARITSIDLRYICSHYSEHITGNSFCV